MRVALVFLGALIRPLGGIWPFLSGEENTACDKAGTCPQEEIEDDYARGSRSSPGAHYWWLNWTWDAEPPPPRNNPPSSEGSGRWWYARILLVFLWEIWEGGLTWCGTLCASIGLAARWTYWLATATIILGTMQLTYWSFVWVVRPILIVVYALTRYVLGHGSWEAVL